MKKKIASLWAEKILNGKRTLNEVPKQLLLEVKQAITEKLK